MIKYRIYIKENGVYKKAIVVNEENMIEILDYLILEEDYKENIMVIKQLEDRDEPYYIYLGNKENYIKRRCGNSEHISSKKRDKFFRK